METDRTSIDRSVVVDEEQMRRMLTTLESSMRRYIDDRLPRSVRAAVSAEDVLQNAWAAAFEQREHFRLVSPAAFENWFRTIVDRKLIDVKRRAYATKRGGATGFRRLIPAALLSWSRLEHVGTGSSQTPSRAASTKEAERAINEGLNGLPEDVRRAVVMHDLQGRPLDEVARSLNRPPSTLRGMLHRGRSRLRELLGDPRRFFSESGIVVKKGAELPPDGPKAN